MITNTLEVTVNVDAQTVTAFFVGLVALLSAYQAYKARTLGQDVNETKNLATETKEVVDNTHTIVNSQRTAMQDLIKRLEGENAELRAEADFTTTEKSKE